MEPLVHAMLSNALAATVLAVLVAILGRACRRPALIHGLWLVVMLKLVTPPVVPVSIPVAACRSIAFGVVKRRGRRRPARINHVGRHDPGR